MLRVIKLVLVHC